MLVLPITLLDEHTGNPTLLAIYTLAYYRSIDLFDYLSYYRYSCALSSEDVVSRWWNDVQCVIEMSRVDEPRCGSASRFVRVAAALLLTGLRFGVGHPALLA